MEHFCSSHPNTDIWNKSNELHPKIARFVTVKGDQHDWCSCRHLYCAHRKVGEMNLATALAFSAVLCFIIDRLCYGWAGPRRGNKWSNHCLCCNIFLGKAVGVPIVIRLMQTNMGKIVSYSFRIQYCYDLDDLKEVLKIFRTQFSFAMGKESSWNLDIDNIITGLKEL